MRIVQREDAGRLDRRVRAIRQRGTPVRHTYPLAVIQWCGASPVKQLLWQISRDDFRSQPSDLRVRIIQNVSEQEILLIPCQVLRSIRIEDQAVQRRLTCS